MMNNNYIYNYHPSSWYKGGIMNSLDYNGVSLIGNVAGISDIRTLPSGKKYKYFDIC